MKPSPVDNPFHGLSLQEGIQRVASIMGWYHTIDFGDGVVAKGIFDHRPYLHHYHFPEDLSGMRVLDIGTANCFFAFEFESRGADEVVAVDIHQPTIVDFICKARKSKVRYVQSSIHDLTPEKLGGTFDMVFCGDLLLHLDDIVGATKTIRSLTHDFAMISTAYAENCDESAPLVHGYLTNISTTSLDGASQGAKIEYPLTWIGNRHFYRRLFEYAGFTSSEILSTHVLHPRKNHNTDIEEELYHIVVRGETR